MSLDRARVKEIFTAAVELARGELDPYLDEACAGDDELRRELESLLAHHDERDLVRPPLPEHSAPTLVPEERGLASAHEHVRYRELDELGVGGCGRVTSTWDRQLRRRVARKQLLIDAPGQRAMLLQEARLLAWLDHPGVVPVYDTEADGEASYTMRLLDGETLRSRIDSEGQLSIPESVRVLTRVSETMANAHAKGVLHLDLKPANLMLLPFGQVCVLDWGVAKFHDLDAYHAYLRTSGETASPAVAAYDGIAGTPSYMPVEQVVGDALSPATDIYAVGIVLYEMLVGRLPHAASGGARSIIHTLSEAIAPPTRFRADIPERLEALCLRMLASNPADRPASFTEVLAEVDGLHGVPVGAERVLQPGEVLFREGEVGVEAFQILEGAVSVTVEGPSGPTEIARRGVGELIGELSVVLEKPRSATVSAIGHTRVARITGDVIAGALKNANPLLARMLLSLSARLRQTAVRARRE